MIIQKAERVISLLEQLVAGAKTGSFGNAIFFDEQPLTAKENDVSLNTTTGEITQLVSGSWVLQYEAVQELNDLEDVTISDNRLNDSLRFDGTSLYINSLVGTKDLLEKEYTIPINSQMVIQDLIKVDTTLNIEGTLFIN